MNISKQESSCNFKHWQTLQCFTFSPNILFLLIIWKFHTMYPIILASHSSQVYPPTLTPLPSPKIHQVQFVLPIYSEHGQTPSGHTLEENWGFLHGLLPEPITCEELHTSASSSQFLRTLFNSFLPAISFLEGGGGCHRNLQCLSFSVLSSHSCSLPTAASGSMDLRYQHHLVQQHGPRASIQPAGAAQITDTSMASKQQHGLSGDLIQKRTHSWSQILFRDSEAGEPAQGQSLQELHGRCTPPCPGHWLQWVHPGSSLQAELHPKFSSWRAGSSRGGSMLQAGPAGGVAAHLCPAAAIARVTSFSAPFHLYPDPAPGNMSLKASSPGSAPRARPLLLCRLKKHPWVSQTPRRDSVALMVRTQHLLECPPKVFNKVPD
jgi:hypothetical protein